MNLFGKILEAAEVLLLGPGLLGWPTHSLNRLAIGSILYATCASIRRALSVGGGLLGLLSILILLEILFGHFSLYNH